MPIALSRRLRRSALALSALVGGACAGRARSLVAPGEALRPCAPASRNCVSTEGDAAHALPRVPFADAPEAAQRRARAALEAEPRTRVVLEAPGYLRAEARSRVFRFVDDVEIVVDSAARVFRFRSESRLGRGDFGVNRARMTRVSATLRAATSP